MKLNRTVVLTAFAVIASSCSTVKSLGTLGAPYPSGQSSEALCIDFANDHTVYPADRSIGVFLFPFPFFKEVVKQQLSKYYSVLESEKCNNSVRSIVIVLREVSFHTWSIGSLVPVYSVQARAAVSSDITGKNGSLVKMETQSAIFHGDYLGRSEPPLIIVARWAIIDAATKHAQKVACMDGLAICPEESITKNEVDSLEIAKEYGELQRSDEPAVQRYLWTVPRNSQ